MSQILKDIEKDFNAKQQEGCLIYTENDGNPYTPTGLQKYAIRKMIYAGMNQSIILEFTGQGAEILRFCQEDANQSSDFERKRYINYIIRGIDTYDLI